MLTKHGPAAIGNSEKLRPMKEKRVVFAKRLLKGGEKRKEKDRDLLCI